MIVRSHNLSRSQQAIQAGHGVAKFVYTFPDLWGNRTLLYLRVGTEEDLINLHQKLTALTDKIVLYSDPSWKSVTSLAVLGTAETMEMVKDLSLI